MKKLKQATQMFTKQFYKGNFGYFALALCETLLGAICALLISWLLQQILDLISGVNTGFTLTELSVISLLLLRVSQHSLVYLFSVHIW